MAKYDFDLLTIGGGSGGVRASRWSASLNAKVAICEESRYGGTCVLRGCVPKKLMLEGAKFTEHIQYFSAYGWELGSAKLNWQTQKQLRDKELSRLENIYENLLSKTGVQVLKGRGKIVAPHTVEIGDKQYTARFILVAVGAGPSYLDIPGHNLAITSDDVFEMQAQPRSILIMGSGYIGVEFASIFNSFGTNVNLVFRRDKPLRGFDNDVRTFLHQEMAKRGVKLFPHTRIEQIAKAGSQLEVHLVSDKGQQKDQQKGQPTAHQKKLVDKVLLATGRKPKTKDLGLEQVGVELNSHAEIRVDDYFESTVPGIYAIGDCASTAYQLTPVATAEGMVLAENLFSTKPKRTMNYDFVPTAVFSAPPVGVVGLTEEQALAQYKDVDVYTSQFRPLKYTVTPIQHKMFMKLVVDKQTNKVLGAHIVGDVAGEIMQGVAVALKMGATKADFDKTIGIHPTSAEELVTMRQPRR